MTVQTDAHAGEKLYTRYQKLATLQREIRTKIDRLKDHREFISKQRFSDLLSVNEELLTDLASRLAPLTARLEAVLSSKELELRSVEADLAPVEKKIQEARILHKINLISWHQLRREIKQVRRQRNQLFKTLKAKRREIQQVQALLAMRHSGDRKKRFNAAGRMWLPWRKADTTLSARGQVQELRAEARALRGVLESLRRKKKKAANQANPALREEATVEQLLAAAQNGDTHALMTMFPASAGITVCVREP